MNEIGRVEGYLAKGEGIGVIKMSFRTKVRDLRHGKAKISRCIRYESWDTVFGKIVKLSLITSHCKT